MTCPVFQPAARSHQRQATLVPREVPAEVAPQEERAEEQLLRAVERAADEPSSAFTHTPTQETLANKQLAVIVVRLFTIGFFQFLQFLYGRSSQPFASHRLELVHAFRLVIFTLA